MDSNIENEKVYSNTKLQKKISSLMENIKLLDITLVLYFEPHN